jgi:hypothetical protein
MFRLYRTLMEVCWALGVVGAILAVVTKFFPVASHRLYTEPRGILAFAAVMFLCALATEAVGRTSAPSH